ncbi:MAG: DUF4249 family protein [Saprospirales bacterium]|nr:DUF4249 family protein [Saprospirales bacterium]
MAFSYKWILPSALALLLFSACNLEKEIELNLPLYDSQLVVECYLEPGKPFNLLLSRSAGFFDPFATETDQFLNEILVDDAQLVEIEHGARPIPCSRASFRF